MNDEMDNNISHPGQPTHDRGKPIGPPQTTEIEKLRAALTEVMVWINEWEPAFIQDGEWRETKRMVRAALGEKE